MLTRSLEQEVPASNSMKALLIAVLVLLSPLTAFAAACANTKAATTYYSFDANSSADNSGNGNNGADFNMTYTGSGKIGAASVFNGTTGRIAGPSGTYSIFNGTNSFSVNVWVKPTGSCAANDCRIFAASNGGNFHNWVQLEQSAGSMLAWRGDGTNQDQVSGGANTVTGGSWVMVTYTYDGSNQQLYSNGSTDGAAVASTRSVPTESLIDLGTSDNSGAKIGWYPGNMDEVGFYPCTLTQAQVTSLYNGGTGINPFTAIANAFRFWALSLF